MKERMSVAPFNLFAAIIFGLAILNMFLTPTLYSISRYFSNLRDKKTKYWKHHHFFAEVFYLLSEVEVVFGLWLVPLLIGFTYFHSWNDAVQYLHSRDYTSALYIMVIVVVVSSRPIIQFAEKVLEYIARLGGDTPGAWWLTILTIGPLFGAMMKEPGAMTLCAILLAKKFYPFKSSRAFQYATLGLLFANISVGGMLTPFASRALFIVAKKWEWGIVDMFTMFGWKAIMGLVLANLLYFFVFRKEFRNFPKTLPAVEKEQPTPPLWITCVHLIFLTLVALTGEHAPIFIGVFILFLGFHRATVFYQSPILLKSAIMVGFFFASLLIHGELQGWWINPLLQDLPELGVFSLSFALSGVADNAVVIYLASKIPSYTDALRYVLVAGSMAAGGLTVVANAPNPIGHAILRPSFGGKISFSRLFLGALPPTLIMATIFWLFR